MWSYGWRVMLPVSEVWRYVTRRDDKTIVCNMCGSQLACSGSATVLRLHLQRNHRIHFTDEANPSNLQGADSTAEKIPGAKDRKPTITELIGIDSPVTRASQSSKRISDMLRECASRLDEGKELERHSILGAGDSHRALTEDELSMVLRSYQLASGGRRRGADLSFKRALPPGCQDKSQAWDFFKKLNERCVECSLCRKQLCYHNSTASLREHLRRKHHLGELELRPCQDEGSSSSESMGQEPELKKNKALSVAEMVLQHQVLAEKREEAIDELLVGMLFRDLQPLSLVGDEGFKRLLSYLEPGYRVPSGAHLSAQLRHKYSLARRSLEHLLRSVRCLALSTHTWSSAARQPYLTVLAHFIDGSWSPACCVLKTGPHPGPERTHELLSAAIGEFGVPSEAVGCVLLDRAAGGGRPLQERLGWSSLGCAGRALQQCIKLGLQLEEVQHTLSGARRLVAHFHRSPRAAAQLSERLAEGSKERAALVMDTASRWDTTFDMCRRLLELRWAVNAVREEDQTVPDLSDPQWELLRDLLPVLKPLKVGLAFLGEEQNASVSSLLPCLHGVLAALAHPPAGTGCLVRAVSARIRSEIGQLWRLQESEEMVANPAVVASFLDPRFKDLRFLAADTRDEVHRRVKALLTAALPEPRSPDGREPPPSEYDLLFGEDPVDRMPEIHQQLDSYVSEPLRKRHTNPFHWWRDNAHRFPAVANLARRYLSVPATAVSAFFSSARLPDETGAALRPEDVDQIIFLHKNFDYIELLK